MVNPMRSYITWTFVCVLATVSLITFASPNFIQTFESNWLKKIRAKFETFHTRLAEERVFLQTDKTFYKPSETIWFSVFLRDAKTFKKSENSDVVHVEFLTPKGTIEKHYKIVCVDGIGKGDFALDGLLGGIYKIKAYTEFQKNDPKYYVFEKEITIQDVYLPRLKLKLDFEKKAYGKGDEVTAKLAMNTNENKPLENHEFEYKLFVAGLEISTYKGKTDSLGNAKLIALLPKDLNSTDGLINILLDFEGRTESISRSIPIVLNQINLSFFPEGGDMVSGVKTLMGFRAINEFEKAADIEGYIFDAENKVVATFSSLHNGMGSFEFTPLAGKDYKAKITKPLGISEIYNLPDALEKGYALKVISNPTTLQINIHAFQLETLQVVAQVRGKIYYSKSFKSSVGDNYIVIPTKDFPIGIAQITLFDQQGIERAERLAFVNLQKQLNVKLTPNKPMYQPREKATLNIRVTDENAMPVAGNFAFSVVDDNLLTFSDDKQGGVLAKMLLEPELKEKIEEPNFYFDKTEKKSVQAMDNLMLTSGWRRFTWKKILSEENVPITFSPEKVYTAEKIPINEIFKVGPTGIQGRVLDELGHGAYPVSIMIVDDWGVHTGAGTQTDFDGNFSILPLNTGKCNIKISALGYSDQLMRNVELKPDFTSIVSFKLCKKVNQIGGGKECQAITYKRPLVDPSARTVNKVAVAEDLKTLPTQNVNDAMAKAAGVFQADAGKGISVRGSREGSSVVYINGMKTTVDISKLKKNRPLKMDDAEKEISKNEEKENAVFEKTKILDERDKELRKDMEKVNSNAVFYRAKEFPKKTYLKNDKERNDFATTLYWEGNIETDANGKAAVEFGTNDLISSFKATLAGFGTEGGIGEGAVNFSTNIPFNLEINTPSQLLVGDKILLPVFVKNNLKEDITGSLNLLGIDCFEKNEQATQSISISAGESKMIYIPLVAKTPADSCVVKLQFIGNGIEQTVQHFIKIIPNGFPANISMSGQDLEKTFDVNLQSIMKGGLHVSFTAFPSITNELMTGVEAILREPNGCFEQTSSSNYPNVIALNYLKTMGVKNPTFEEKAYGMIDRGYKKLLTFETKEKGYEWFGNTPSHEALTAYGLMEFVDMKKVYPGVSDEMLDRTRKLLLSKRDGNGGFVRSKVEIDQFGKADEDVTNAYIVYALTESGQKDLEKELDAVYKIAKKTSDPYILALVANSLFNVGDQKRGDEIMNEIAKEKNDAGFWTGKKHSITHSTGEALNIETTALIALAGMKSQKPANITINSAIKFIVGSRSGFGNFGSTQSTILALKALTNFAIFSKKTEESGVVELFLNDKLIGTKKYEKGATKNVEINNLENNFAEGPQKITVKYKGCKTALPYALNINYTTLLPNSDKNCALNLETKIVGSKTVKVGELLRLTSTLKNTQKAGQPMSMLIVGIPAGFTPQPWQLKELQDKKVVDYYEILNNNVVCYFRGLAPNEERTVNLDLKAEIPGDFDAPASSAYLYYTNESKVWTTVGKVLVNR